MSDDQDDTESKGPGAEKTETERPDEGDAPTLLPQPMHDRSIEELVNAIQITKEFEAEEERDLYAARLDHCRLVSWLWERCCADRAAATSASDRAKATTQFLLAGKQCKLSESVMYERRHLGAHIKDIHERAMAEREMAGIGHKKLTWPTFRQMCKWFPRPLTAAQQKREESRVDERLVRAAGEELAEARRNETEHERERDRLALHDRLIELEAALTKAREDREQERRDRQWAEAQAEQNAREITALRAENAALLAKLAANDPVKTEDPVKTDPIDEVEVDDDPPPDVAGAAPEGRASNGIGHSASAACVRNDHPPVRETIGKAKEWLDGMSEERLAELDTDHELTKFRGTGTVKKVKLDIAKDQRRAAFLLLNRESEQFYDNLALTLRFQRISFWWRVTDDMTILDVQALLPPLDGQEDPSAVDGGAEPEPPAITPSQPMGSPDDV